MVWTSHAVCTQATAKGCGENLQYISDSLPTGSMTPAKVKKLVLLWH